MLRSCSIAGDHPKKQLLFPGISHKLMQSNYSILHHLMQALLSLLLFLLLCDSEILPNVLWEGFELANSLSGAHDYARSIVQC